MCVGKKTDFTGRMSLFDRENEEWERRVSNSLSRATQEELTIRQTDSDVQLKAGRFQVDVASILKHKIISELWN